MAVHLVWSAGKRYNDRQCWRELYVLIGEFSAWICAFAFHSRPPATSGDVQWQPLTGRSVSVRAATSMPASQPGARPPSGGASGVVSMPLR